MSCWLQLCRPHYCTNPVHLTLRLTVSLVGDGQAGPAFYVIKELSTLDSTCRDSLALSSSPGFLTKIVQRLSIDCPVHMYSTSCVDNFQSRVLNCQSYMVSIVCNRLVLYPPLLLYIH